MRGRRLEVEAGGEGGPRRPPRVRHRLPALLLAMPLVAGAGPVLAQESSAVLPTPLSARLEAGGLALPPAWGEAAAARAAVGAAVGSAALAPTPALALRVAGVAPGEGETATAGGEEAAPAIAAWRPAAEARIRQSRQLAVGVLLAWGVLKWDYGQRSPHLANERWFQADTAEGGADKLGHLYTAQALTRGMAALYRGWGLDASAAAREGALTALLVTGVMEVGDGFSPYGVAAEDMVMNLAGTWAGRELARRPAWRERVDVRVEYRFSADSQDISTDYERARFLVALKPAGFAAWRDSPLRWLELQLGYYARGYDRPQAPDRRVPYAAIGLNLPLLARRAGLPRVAGFLQFYQPPDSSWRGEDPR